MDVMCESSARSPLPIYKLPFFLRDNRNFQDRRINPHVRVYMCVCLCVYGMRRLSGNVHFSANETHLFVQIVSFLLSGSSIMWQQKKNNKKSGTNCFRDYARSNSNDD